MQVKNYWVGDRPAGTWTFQVLDQKTGSIQDLKTYTSARVLMVGPNNESIEVPTNAVVIVDPANGLVNFAWPTVSLFTKAGRYLVQLELSNASTTRKTTVQDILVRDLGGVVE